MKGHVSMVRFRSDPQNPVETPRTWDGAMMSRLDGIALVEKRAEGIDLNWVSPDPAVCIAYRGKEVFATVATVRG